MGKNKIKLNLLKDFRKLILKSFSEINQEDYVKELKLLIEKLQPLGKGLKEYQKNKK
jgi:hypothetical protein